MPSENPLPRPVLVVSLALAGLLVVTVAALGLLLPSPESEQNSPGQNAPDDISQSGPLALASIPAPQAAGAECAQILAAAPPTLLVDGRQVPRRPLADPAPAGAMAWGDDEQGPIVLRCGIDAPAQLQPTSPLVEVSGVSWLTISEGGMTSWFAVDRPVYVAVTVLSPDGSGGEAVQDVSRVLHGFPKLPAIRR